RPRYVDRPVVANPHRLVIRELTIGSLGDSLSIECADKSESLTRICVTTLQPGLATVGGPAEIKHRTRSVVTEAGEISGSLRVERDSGVAAEFAIARPRHSWIIGEARDSRDESRGQCLRPRLAPVERSIHSAAIVVIPIVVAGENVLRIVRIHSERGLVL